MDNALHRQWAYVRREYYYVFRAGIATSVIVVSYPFTPVFWWWFALRCLHGFAVSMLFAISEAWIVRFAEGPYRSRILALYTSILAASFGGGPALISLTGTAGPAPFLIGAAILLVATIPVLFVRDAPVDSADEEVHSVVSFAGKAPLLLAAVGIFAIVDAANLRLGADDPALEPPPRDDVEALALTERL